MHLQEQGQAEAIGKSSRNIPETDIIKNVRKIEYEQDRAICKTN